MEELDIEFNLLDEPWIIVRTKSNETKTLSLLEVFKQAHEIQALAGELPTQDIAIMRLLLAVMHAAFIDDRVEDSEDAVDCWMELWGMKKFPFDIIREYLEQYRDRFWLFHPAQPFYQSAHIVDNMAKYKAGKGKKASEEIKWKTVARLVGDLFQSDNALRLFPGRTGSCQETISYDEAARWLIHLNAFDDDSAKNPTPKGVGYLGKLGLVYIKGDNLFETLMLNFVLVDHRDEIYDDCRNDSKAYWEKEPVCETIERLITQPRAQKDLLTMQSRRILLRREKGEVTGYLLTMGDYFEKGSSLINETMTTWKNDKTGIMPKEHQLECQMWRDFSALLGMSTAGNTMKPGVVQWFQHIKKEIPELQRVKVVVTGAHYDLKGAGWQIVDYIYDDLSINASLIDNMNAVWIDNIIKVLDKTKEAVKELGKLSFNIAEASGDSDKNRKIRAAQTARENGYSQLDSLFRDWLVSVDPQKDILPNKMAEWLELARAKVLTLGQEMLRQCSETAIVGRSEESKEISAVKAYRYFQLNIREILGSGESYERNQ